MAENLTFQLRNGNKLTSRISIRIRYADFSTYSKQSKVPFTSADHILIPKVLELFDSLYERRVLVRLVGVNFGNLVSGNYQIDLFDDTEDMLNLYGAMDHIRRRFGQNKVMRATSMGAKTIGRNNPFTGEPPMVLAHRHQ